MLVCGVALVAAIAWVGVRGFQAAHALHDVQRELRATQSAVAAGQVDQAGAHVVAAQQAAQRAHHLTSDPVFALASAVPWLGQTPNAVRTVSATVDDLARGPLADLVAAGHLLAPASLRPQANQLNVPAIQQAAPYLASAAADLHAAQVRIDALPVNATPGRLQSSVTALRDQLSGLASDTASAAKAAQVAPAMLGADGPRTYFLAFQSPNEARGTGGLLGAYGLLRVDNGTITIEKLAPNTALPGTWRTLPVNLGKAYHAFYDDQSAMWSNANLSPNYPYAAQLWRAMYQQHHHTRIDGVITVDPVVLSYVLSATGPVELPDGRVITDANVVRFSQHEIYHWSSNDAVRNAYLQQIARAAFHKVFAGTGSTQGLLDAFARGAGEKRVLVWSSHPADEQVLATTSVGGQIPEGPQPYAGLAVINASGDKMDYYLQPGLRYAVSSCQPDGARNVTITATLTNTASRHDKLPLYVDGRLDRSLLPSGRARPGRGTYYDYAQVYGTQGSTLVSATLNGKRVGVMAGVERGKPVYRIGVVLRPGRTSTIVLHLQEPPLAAGVSPVPQTFVTPLVKAPVVSADAKTCPSPH